MELYLSNYRTGIRVGLWLLSVFAGLAGISLMTWGLLAALGDTSGATVARVLALVWGTALLVVLLGLVALLARVQLNLMDRDQTRDRE